MKFGGCSHAPCSVAQARANALEKPTFGLEGHQQMLLLYRKYVFSQNRRNACNYKGSEYAIMCVRKSYSSRGRGGETDDERTTLLHWFCGNDQHSFWISNYLQIIRSHCVINRTHNQTISLTMSAKWTRNRSMNEGLHGDTMPSTMDNNRAPIMHTQTAHARTRTAGHTRRRLIIFPSLITTLK